MFDLGPGFEKLSTQIHKKYRQSHVGKAVIEAVRELVAAREISAEAGCILVNQLDHTIVKTIRTCPRTEPMMINAGRLAAYRWASEDVGEGRFFVRFRKNSTAEKLKRTQFFGKNSIFWETQPDFP